MTRVFRNPILIFFDLPQDVKALLLILVMVPAAAFATNRFGILAVPASVALLVPVMVLMIGYRMFWYTLLLLIAGYLFTGKGIAYAGYNPIFISELTLALGVLSVVLIPFSDRLKVANIPVHWVLFPLLGFMLWQVYATIPYLNTYRMDTLRDAMLYGYALYALLIFILIPRDMVIAALRLYKNVLPILMFTLPVLWVLSVAIDLPIRLPRSPVPIISLKGGDVGVHLGGAAAFMLLRLDRAHGKAWPQWLLWSMWLMWGINWALFGSLNRGGMVSCLLAVGVVMLFRPVSGWYRPLTVAIFAISVLLVTDLYSNLQINTGRGRTISAEQIVNNLMSVLGTGNDAAGELENTKEWRLEWWGTIVHYTFEGPYFWTGKGYGINLAVADGAYSEELARNKGTRSPHNSFMTILARSGVPGFLLWLSFVASLAIWLLREATLRKESVGSDRSRYALWFLAYAAAFLCNANFDVFLEGPMGGVPFWSLVGLALVYFSGKVTDSSAGAGKELHHA